MDENMNPAPGEEQPHNPFPEEEAEQKANTGAETESVRQGEQTGYQVPQQQQPRRPFFRDTWEILKHMFTRHADRILTVAAGDDYPVWHSNLVVVLLAALVSALLALALNPAVRMLLNCSAGWVAALIVLDLALTAVNFFLLTLAVRTAVKVSGGKADWRQTANVVSCCSLVTAALALVGSIIPVVGAPIAVLVSLVVTPVLLYNGFRKLSGEDGHMWPFIWSIVLYFAAAALIALIVVGLFAAGTVWSWTYYNWAQF